ncbi:MAG: hypothetical protein V1875_07400 [Candidatus Altiarchaeota archaeon]
MNARKRNTQGPAQAGAQDKPKVELLETVETLMAKGAWAEAARRMQESVSQSYDELKGQRAKDLSVLFALEHQRLPDGGDVRVWNVQVLEALRNLEEGPASLELRNAYRRYLQEPAALDGARADMFRRYGIQAKK